MRNSKNQLRIENYIWLIYIFIAIFAIISNYYEDKYNQFKIYQDQKIYHNINKCIFIIAIFIYLYFLWGNLKEIKKGNFAFLAVFAATLFFIGGILNLYLEYQYSYEDEIGLI